MSAVSSHQIEEKILPIVKSFLNSNGERHKIDISPASQPGENYLGLIYTVTITDKKDEKLHLIIKLAPFQEHYRNIFPIKEVYNREIFFYQNVSTELVRIQEEMGISDVFQPFPKLYLTRTQDRGEALVMDNMKKKSFTTVSQRVEADYPHALLVMRDLGKLHALSYAIKDHKPDTFKYFEQNLQESFYNSSFLESVIEMIVPLGNKVLKSYDAEKESLHFESLKGSLEKAADTLRSLLEVGEYCVINHGDAQTRNFLFRYGDPTHPSEPTELCMLDWQLVRIGSPALDILFFIFVCTNQELRSKYYTRLLEEYYSSLSDVLRRLGSDPAKLLPYDVLMDHLRECAPYGLIMAVLLIAMNMKESKNVPDLYNWTADQAIVEEFAVVPSDEYVTRVREVISDFFKYGYKF
ncbi:uncharacterized protein LOC116164492 [Photinus pyralis]|uniref:uncharacterized protein LOC116164492 n=1 Tax=Photinus pyralis TaxID=7054 RepID=UPI0012676271|nr:uncharacterized protein LOC116164492 [Photinus pyralis]